MHVRDCTFKVMPETQLLSEKGEVPGRCKIRNPWHMAQVMTGLRYCCHSEVSFKREVSFKSAVHAHVRGNAFKCEVSFKRAVHVHVRGDACLLMENGVCPRVRPLRLGGLAS